MPLSAPEYWLEWTKNYFRCQFTHVGELIHKETWSSASFGWAEGLQTINPPIYRLTTAVSDIDLFFVFIAQVFRFGITWAFMLQI